ncbi:MAG TPA: hypothetical protein VFJ90_16035 [Candidatus Didemnitutus sp.]|nr:hypothetical protein [Candidatus Didemnitutus sp.]
MFSRFGSILVSLLLLAPALRAWDYTGHRIVNEVALASLPADFPAFVHEPANAERIAWLCSEPDRWRSAVDLPARHINAPDHYLDLEELEDAGLSAATVSSFRYDFTVQYSQGRAAHPQNFAPIDASKDGDHLRIWPGFLPWSIAEYFGKLRADFARLKVLQELGTPDEIVQTKASIVELMGIMGHYVGDGAQPLHTTKHHNGWVGDNPKGYTTWNKFHSWVDGGFIAKANITFANVRGQVKSVEPLSLASLPSGRDPMFDAVMTYLLDQNKLLEPLYQLEKDGKLNHDDSAPSAEGRAFIEGQLVTGGEMLGRIWLTAWRSAAPDTYLRSQLVKGQAADKPEAAGKPVKKP